MDARGCSWMLMGALMGVDGCEWTGWMLIDVGGHSCMLMDVRRCSGMLMDVDRVAMRGDGG
eukprot:1430994-Lingulodinium_polyedra.AAC.1